MSERRGFQYMPLGRYIGVVRAFVYGDVERAKGLRLIALNQLGLMRHQMMLDGDLTGKRTVTLPDGSVIETAWDGTMSIVRITAPGGEAPEEEEYEFPYLSGLQEIAAVLAPLDGPIKLASQFYPAWQVPDGRALQWYPYNVGYDEFDWPVTPTDAETIGSNPGVAFTHEWIKTTLPNIDAGPSALKGFPLWPGMYTGRMRQVAQKALGYRQRVAFSLNSGLWTPDGPQDYPDQRQRWVIEISTLTGVTAYPIRFVDELEAEGVIAESLTAEERERYDYGLQDAFTIPAVISTDPADVFGNADGERCRFQLLPAEDIAEIHADRGTITAWYPNWAFSYSGHEAQIVLVGIKPYSTNLAARYAWRYKLTFSSGTFSIDGREIPYPSSATLTLVEGDYLHTDEFDLQLFAPLAYPYQEAVYFDNAGSMPEPRDTPIYVFYTRDDKEVVLRRYDQSYVAVSETEQTGIDCDTPGCTVPCVYCDQPNNSSLGSLCADAGCQRYTPTAESCEQGFIETRNGTYGYAMYYCERTFDKESSFTGYINGIYRWIDWDETPTPANNAVCNLLFYDNVVITEFLKSVGHQLTTAAHDETRVARSVIILPLYDREGFFHIKSRTTNYAGSFLNTYYIDNSIQRCSKIIGPYPWMPEVSAVAPYAFPGGFVLDHSETTQPPDVVDLEAKYIGSVAVDKYGAVDSVLTLPAPPDGTVFMDGMTAVAAMEMFAGQVILAPHPPTVDDGQGGEKANIWVSTADGSGDGAGSYPAADAYRSQHLLSPKYFCFIGDGTLAEKQGMVDMNAISYLAKVYV